ncbi:S-adenosyl-L-methionine-dependent methyltransferase [Clavulina sp. PMI_390]|nr:S-adenosyl-L-methionine-dependent methyltransferase [Clavulina sp. PMI_390]
MDLRNTYIVSGFALIEHLRAPYVVVENVLNMARFPLKARDGANGALVGGIKWGTHKWIMRMFLDLGYQVRFGLLDAASFGSPQSRYRMIYVATQMGLGLPKLPTPTHLPHPEALLARKVQTPWGVPVPLATVEEPGTTKWRAHSPISVFDAIGDLPKFDWAEEGHGQNTWPTVDPQKAAENDRRCGLGKDGTVRYRTKAKTAYQQWSRGGTVEQYPEVSDHSTIIYSPIITERVIHVPMEARANHLSLSPSLQVHSLAHSESAFRNRQFPRCYGRLDPTAHFRTIVTQIHPGHRQGEVLHPTQHRVLTVREYARAQGFPDRTSFKSETNSEEDRYRQIGNAIPVPLSAAIARSFMALNLSRERVRH